MNRRIPGKVGTAGRYNVGTAAGNIPRLDASARLPALDSSQLTSIPAVAFDGFAYNGIGWNGSMDVSQINGTNAVVLATGVSAGVNDGWYGKFVRAATLAISCQQVTPPGSPSFQSAFQNSLQIKATAGLASLAAGDYGYLEHSIEGYRAARLNFGNSNAQSVTVGFWVYATIAGTATVALVNSATNRSNPTNFTINNPTTWEYKTVTFTGDNTGTWLYTASPGVRVRFCFGAGATFQGTNATWAGGELFATSTTTNFFASTNNLACITGVVVVPGTDAPSQARSLFIMRPLVEELGTAQRYYWKTFQTQVVPVQGSGSDTGALAYRTQIAGTTAGFDLHVRFPRTMRIAPTITFYNPISVNAAWYNSTAAADSGTAAATRISEGGFTANNPQVAGDAVSKICSVHVTADAR